jgi:hypothetical protein
MHKCAIGAIAFRTLFQKPNLVIGALKNKEVIITGSTRSMVGYMAYNYLGIALARFRNGF